MHVWAEGETTFAATAPRPLSLTARTVKKYFRRGIGAADAGSKNTGWGVQEFVQNAPTDNHDTVIIDPIGELMEKVDRLHAKPTANWRW